ncbi:Death on curing protein [Trichophyton rubrum]|nr:Death on curing protein [Trichophyton rubrum]
MWRSRERSVIRVGKRNSSQPPSHQHTPAKMPPNIRFLTMSQVKRLHAAIISPNTVPTQPNLLESAVHSPMNLNHYAGQEDIFQLAANLSEKIMRNHAYQDGNKRTALVAADMFLKINGHHLQGGLHGESGGLAQAQVALVINQISTEDLGRYYKSVSRNSPTTST